MKIGFVSPHTFTYPGGVQKHTLALKKDFEKRGNFIKLIVPREEISQKKEKDIILLGGSFFIKGNASKANVSFQVTPLKIKKMLNEENFNILHFQNFGIFLPIQVLESSDSLRRDKKPPLKILTLHALWDASRIFKDFPFLLNIFNNYFLPKFDGVIGVSQPVLDQIKYQGISQVIPNGVDLDFFKPQGEKIKKFQDKKINILFVGRIEERKGLFYLVRAFENLKKRKKDIRLIVVGEGKEEKKEIVNFIRKKKIKDVIFEGKVEEKDLPKYYRTCDIFCSPAIFGESFGIVLLEAMACQKPIVAFANTGYKEVLKGKGRESLVKVKDIKALEKKLFRFIKEKKLRQNMAVWGLWEAKKYSWERVAKDTLKFYDKVLKSKNIIKKKK